MYPYMLNKSSLPTNLNRRLPLRVLHHVTHERASQQNRRLIQTVMLVAKRAHSAGLKDQTRVVCDVLVDPAACESSQEVAVGYDQHVEGLGHAAFGLSDGVGVEALADVGDDGVTAGGDVGGGSGGVLVGWSSNRIHGSGDGRRLKTGILTLRLGIHRAKCPTQPLPSLSSARESSCSSRPRNRRNPTLSRPPSPRSAHQIARPLPRGLLGAIRSKAMVRRIRGLVARRCVERGGAARRKRGRGYEAR